MSNRDEFYRQFSRSYDKLHQSEKQDDLVDRVARVICCPPHLAHCCPKECSVHYFLPTARATIAVALEEAAKEIERQATIAFEVDQCSHWERECVLSLAAAIRALIPKEEA